MERQQVLQIVKKAVHEVDDKAEIILFGSRARGDFHEESDWDFLILTEEKESNQLRNKIWGKMFDAELETDEIFGTIVHNKSEWERYEITPLYQFVQTEGVRL
jgi:predicted nucleotidyltransferase